MQLLSAVCKNKDIEVLLSSNAEDFFQSHGDIWEYLRDYYLQYRTVPDVEVLEQEFDDFEGVDVGNSSTEFLRDKVREAHLNDELAKLLQAAAKNHGKIAAVKLIDKLQSELGAMAKHSDIVRDVDLTDHEAAKQFFEEKHRKALEMGGSPGIPTGFKVFDIMYPTGLAGGQLIVIIGWSGRGKSWFANLLAARAWNAGYKPMIISLEMSPEEVRERVYTIMGSGLFKQSDFSRGSIDIHKFEDWGKNKLSNKQPFVIVSSEGLSEVTPRMVQSKIEQYRPDIVFLDYQQLFDSDTRGGSETEKNKNISRSFKRLAISNDIPIVNLSQATQDDSADTDEPPRIEQVAWSKSIQHDANLAIAVHKYDSAGDDNMFSVIARKNRHGELFEFDLEWDINRGVIKEIV